MSPPASLSRLLPGTLLANHAGRRKRGRAGAQQQKILARYRETRPDVPLQTLTINFDDQKEYVRQFGAPRQSTLILYQGEERIWFSVAELRDEVIFAALDAAAGNSRR